MANNNKALEELLAGIRGGMEEGSEDFRQAFFDAREMRGDDPTDAPKFSQMFGTNPTLTTLRDLTGTSDPLDREARRRLGMGIRDTTAGKVGQVIGRVGNDIVNDKSRSVWWLLNAPQAAVSYTHLRAHET